VMKEAQQQALAHGELKPRLGDMPRTLKSNRAISQLHHTVFANIILPNSFKNDVSLYICRET
jgi:hypothetical protein